MLTSGEPTIGRRLIWSRKKGGGLEAFEFKFTKTGAKPPFEFIEAYPGSSFEVIHRKNYLDFIV